MSEGPVSVLAVDDSELFRQVLRDVVRATEGFRLVGAAGSGDEALAAAEELCPDLVIMDCHMPGMSGLEAARRLAERDPDLVVLLVSADHPGQEQLLASKATHFVSKQQLSPALLRELWGVRAA